MQCGQSGPLGHQCGRGCHTADPLAPAADNGEVTPESQAAPLVISRQDVTPGIPTVYSVMETDTGYWIDARHFADLQGPPGEHHAPVPSTLRRNKTGIPIRVLSPNCAWFVQHNLMLMVTEEVDLLTTDLDPADFQRSAPLENDAP